ncbi:MAG TPA: asparagine synthase B [Candidatus Nanoarchaeia archaeon]|nr:asparagine synthase B [Candidatus Nanoarchaeia archaeon]
MCGITAVIGKKTIDEVAVRSARMRHRGPDERDILLTNMGILSHERLSIMDLTTGKQPIQGTRNTYVIHNGEIYNYKKVYETDLKGTQRRTTSDSEVIVHLYEKYGNDFCNRLDGMFAFVVFDVDKNKLIAARDPIGVKPLYYGKDKDGALWFASEMKTICDTCNDVAAFPPGHYYTPETGFVKYYSPRWEREPATDKDPRGLRELLEASVEKRLMSDVPLGVLLSGGLDSSLISSIVCRKLRGTGQDLHSFSIGLSADAPDIQAARKVAKFLGTKHHEVYFTVEEGIQALDKLIWHLESYDVTTIRASTPMYILSQYIRQQGIKVILSGEGADEVFGGYLYFYNAPNDEAFQEETKRRVRLLSTADILRADKSTMAHGIELREPMLDLEFLEKAIGLSPTLKRPLLPTATKEGRIEKFVLRKAFDDKDDPYLPENILWRQKEQFSDGVGYNWMNSLVAHCEAKVSDNEFAQARERFPHNTPTTKEAFYIRKNFHRHFPQDAAAKTVRKWVPKWQKSKDPSGRVNNVHQDAVEKK